MRAFFNILVLVILLPFALLYGGFIGFLVWAMFSVLTLIQLQLMSRQRQ